MLTAGVDELTHSIPQPPITPPGPGPVRGLKEYKDNQDERSASGARALCGRKSDSATARLEPPVLTLPWGHQMQDLSSGPAAPHIRAGQQEKRRWQPLGQWLRPYW